MSSRIFLLALLVLTTTRAQSQDVSPSATALDELIARALQSNPQPQIAAANVEAARARARSARATPGPVLQITPGIGGTAESRDEEIVLAQPLDLFGQRRAGRAVFEAQLRGAQARSDAVARALIVAVKSAAAELFAAQEAVSLGEAQLEIAQQFRAAAARRAQLGEVPAVQTQRAQLELDRAALELEAARAERAIRRARLNQLIGAPPGAPLVVTLPTTVPVAPPISADFDAMRATLQVRAQERPDLVSAQATIDGARAQANAIAAQRRPQLELQLRRGGVFDATSTSLRAVLTVPLFDFGESRNQQRAAQFEAQAEEKQLELLRSQVAAQLESALTALNQNRALAARYRDSLVPLALDLLRKTRIGYEAGASTYLEVLEAQRAVKQIQTEYLQALAGVRTSETDLESALGSDYLVPVSALSQPDVSPAPPGVAAPGTLPADAVTTD